MQKNGYTFAIVYSSKCVSVFLNQTLSTAVNSTDRSQVCKLYTRSLAPADFSGVFFKYNFHYNSGEFLHSCAFHILTLLIHECKFGFCIFLPDSKNVLAKDLVYVIQKCNGKFRSCSFFFDNSWKCHFMIRLL